MDMDVAAGDVLREVFRFAAKADASSYSTVVAAGSHEPRRRMTEGILFSRRFILSYNIVLLSILSLVSISHWFGQIRRSQGRRRAVPKAVANRRTQLQVGHESHSSATPDGVISSSSSSNLDTSSAVSSEPSKEGNGDNESTPLIRKTRAARKSWNRCLRSWLMWQPQNIPILNKTLPANATSLAVLLFLGLNIFYLFYRVDISVSTLFIFADRAGLVFVANLPLLYVFAAKNQPIKWLTGYSYEGLNIFHRRLGEMMCFCAFLHGAGMLAVWYTLLYPRIDIWTFLSIKLIWLGVAAFVGYELLYLTSLGSFRQKFYELFLALHVLLQAAALGFLFFHHHGARPYVLVALVVFSVDRLCRLLVRTGTLRADLSVLEDGETILLSSDWDVAFISHPTWWRRALAMTTSVKAGWKPTEHVFLTVPALSRNHVIQAHPFTIASAAPVTCSSSRDVIPQGQHAWLSLIIRARNGFSADLLRYAQSHRSVSVRLDGPYGSMHALEMLEASDVALVVAGGSGIAVAFPLVWSLVMCCASRHRCSNKDGEEKRVGLIWVVHDAAHIDWIGDERLQELRDRGVGIVVPPPTRKAGRPDIERLLEAELSALSYTRNPSVGVLVSGPDSMNRSTRNACAKLVRQGLDVKISVEKFGW